METQSGFIMKECLGGEYKMGAMGALSGLIVLFFGILFLFVFSKKAIKNKELRAEEMRERLEKREEIKRKSQQIKNIID